MEQTASRAPTADDDADLAIVVGWAPNEAAIPEARKGTHDTLRRLYPRAGGIEWREYRPQQGRTLLNGMLADETRSEYRHGYKNLRRLLKNGGFLIAATAPIREV